MDRATAIALVTAQAAVTTYPTLDTTEVDALIDATVGYTVWKPQVAYVYGDRVQPTVANGHIYRCVVAGTSDTAEPFWPTYTRPDNRIGLTRPHWHGYIGPLPGSQVGDGQTLVWLEDGFDAGQYDARLATYRAWLQKAAKATADYDVQKNNDQFSRSQVVAQCFQMARLYTPMRIA